MWKCFHILPVKRLVESLQNDPENLFEPILYASVFFIMWKLFSKIPYRLYFNPHSNMSKKKWMNPH